MTRMVIFAALLGVLDPVLTIAAAASGDDLLRLPSEATISEITGSSSTAEAATPSGDSSRDASSVKTWFKRANDILEQQKQKLAPGARSDSDLTLAIFKVSECIKQSSFSCCDVVFFPKEENSGMHNH